MAESEERGRQRARRREIESEIEIEVERLVRHQRQSRRNLYKGKKGQSAL